MAVVPGSSEAACVLLFRHTEALTTWPFLMVFTAVPVPPVTWHQFRAGATSPLGFLCLDDAERDKSQLPSARDLEEMRAHPVVARFLSTKGDRP